MTRDANKQSVKCEGRHNWIQTDNSDFNVTREDGHVECSLCGAFPTTSQFEQAEATARLRDWIKPGDTLYTQIKHVSRSGMMRVIQVIKISCRAETNIDGNADPEPSISYLGYNIAKVLGWKYDNEREGIKVGGCGMDMGFHVVHSLGYALYGKEASEGESDDANALRAALLKADRFYFTQGGQPEPDTSKPDRLWFGGAGYALKHRWL